MTLQVPKTWDEETGRGWRGPYLNGFKDGYVDIGSEINEDATPSFANEGIQGDPLEVSHSATHFIPTVLDVYGVADPFKRPAEPVADSDADNTLLDWSVTHRDNAAGTAPPGRDPEMNRWGRPYLYFLEIEDTNGDGVDEPQVCLVSMGPDGNFDNGEHDPANHKDDIILIIE